MLVIATGFYAGLLEACPYIFINDTNQIVLVVEHLGNAYIIPAGKVARIQAPMIENQSHETKKWKMWQGHSTVGIYIPTLNDDYGNKVFEVLIETREHHCGKGSSLRMSQLMRVTDKEDFDRFRIKRMNEARKIKRLQKYEKRKTLEEQLALEENPEKIFSTDSTTGTGRKRKLACACAEKKDLSVQTKRR